MGILAKIFGSSDVVKEGISMIRDAGDALVYTYEEKAGDRQAAKMAEINAIIQWMDTTKGQNLARRLLAVMITGVWLAMYAVSMIVNVIAIWATNPEQWRLTATVIGGFANQMNGAMMLILAFYFAAPHMSKIVDGALSKFGQGATK